jgi:tol-pal system protein YbgF
MKRRYGDRPKNWTRRFVFSEHNDENHDPSQRVNAMKIWIGVFLLSVVIFGGCATTQDVMVIDERIGRLEAQRVSAEKEFVRINDDLSSLGKQKDLEDQTGKGRYAGLRVQVNDLETQLNSLRGQLEVLDYSQGRFNEADKNLENKLKRLDLAITATTDRVIRLEQYLGLAPAVAAGADSPPPGKQNGAQKMSDDALYKMAKQSFDAGKYDAARTGFQRLLKDYPNSKNADNAQFWVGETYYREKWYEKAILEYHEVIKTYPKGNKARAAMLKQGLAFEAIGDKKNARLMLKELVRKHPQSNEAEVAKKKLKDLK